MKRLLMLPLIAVAAIGGSIAISSGAMAHVVPSTNDTHGGEVRCAIAKGRITNMIDSAKTMAERRSATYSQSHEKILSRAATLKQKGYDTAKLDSDLKVLDSQINDYRAKSESFVSALIEAQNTACGDSDSSFKDALARSRTQLRIARESMQLIHKTLRTTIVADIKSAAQWLKNN